MPSVITFLENSKTAIGRDAYEANKTDPSKTLVYDVKRMIGKYPGHPEIEQRKNTWPF